MSKLTVNDIRVELTSTPKEKTPDDKLGFGTVFTDHMFVMDWTSEKGWYDPRMKKISTEARLDMEKLFDTKVFLKV